MTTSPITIGVFSPSSPISATVPVRYERGKRFMEAHGFRVLDGALYGRRDGYRSGTIAQRAAEFNALLHDDRVQLLMAAIGGNNTNSILPYIDYDYLKAHPKPVVGYSDATALLLAIYAKTGIPTFYGPALAASFGELPPYAELTLQYFTDIVTDPVPLPHRFPTPPYWTDERIDWATRTVHLRQPSVPLARASCELPVADGKIRLAVQTGGSPEVFVPEGWTVRKTR